MRKLFILFTFLSVSLMGFATQICDVPLGHLNNPEFGDLNGRILFSVEPTGNTNEYKVTIKPNGGSKKLDYLYIELGNGATTSPYPITAGTDDNGEEFDEMTATFTYTGTTGSMGSIQWSHPSWNGRWGCSYADIDFANLQACGETCSDSDNPSVSAVAVSSITYNSAVLTITASDNDGGSGISQYIVKNGASQIASSTTTPITVTGLSSGTTYDNIKVIAKDACDNESSEYTVASFTTLTRESECIGAKGHFGNPSVKKVYYQIDYVGGNAIINLRSLTGNDLDFAEVHIVGVGNYAMTADGNGGYTYTINSPSVNAEWYLRFLYSDTSFGGNEMTAQDLNASDANIIYYKVGECTSTETENANIALSSAGASATASSGTAANAIDDNEGSRWESDFEDPQWICVDFGARKVFNKVQLLHQTAYIKSFQIQVSDDGTNFITIKNVSETLTDFDGEKKLQNIDLGGKFAARYLRIYGTERGTQWGYSLFELRAMYATTPVLTTYTLSIPTSFCTIGTTYPLTLTAKDQLGNDFPVETTYTVSPTSAGTVSAGVFTPLLQGSATITAEGGGKSSSVTVRNEVSADLALNKPATAGHNNENAYQSNNGNLGQRWGSSGATHYNAGANPDFGDWWYVDLGAKYDISEIAIKWETARPNDYDIRVSDDATSWTNIGVFNSYPSNTDYEYYNSLSAVPGRYVGVWARAGHENLAYGISMWDFQVFGTENVSANKFVSATASPAAGGNVTVQAGGIDATEVPNNTEVTFTATPNEGYDFVNWTNGGVEVSTSATYVVNITASTSLVANFEVKRTAYCATPVSEGSLYLTITNPSSNTYKILLEGSESCKLESAYNNFNFALTHINGENGTTSLPAANWTVDNTGFGSAYVTFTATDFRAITFVSRYVVFNKQGGGLKEFNGFPDANLIKWDATCVDEEAPVLAAPVATPMSGTSVRLALSATDDMAALLTYNVNYKPEGDAGTGIDINFPGTAGATTYRNIGDLTPGIRYQFSVTVSDGIHTSAAQICYATLSARPTAPVPTIEARFVRSVYSDAYESALAHDFIKNNWAWPTYTEDIINGDHMLVYTSNPAEQAQMPDVAWGTNNDGDDAIIAKDGYNDGTNKGLDVRTMGYIHFDIWSAIATNYPEVYLNDTKVHGFALNGSGWQSFDISLSSLTDEQKSNVRFIKFIAFRTPNPEEIVIDNVFFYECEDINFPDDADNSATITANDDKLANVTLNRDILANGEWFTLCLPFDMSAQKVKDVFGNSTIAEMTSSEDRGSLIHLNFDYVQAIEARKPYLIKVSKDFHAGNVIPNVVIKDVAPIELESTYMKFKGTYKEITLSSENQRFVGPENYLYSPADGGTTMGAFRCYFTIPASSPAPGKRARIVFGEQTATGIGDVQSDNVQSTKVLRDGQLLIIRDGRTYNAQGMLVK